MSCFVFLEGDPQTYSEMKSIDWICLAVCLHACCSTAVGISACVLAALG